MKRLAAMICAVAILAAPNTALAEDASDNLTGRWVPFEDLENQNRAKSAIDVLRYSKVACHFYHLLALIDCR